VDNQWFDRDPGGGEGADPSPPVPNYRYLFFATFFFAVFLVLALTAFFFGAAFLALAPVAAFFFGAAFGFGIAFGLQSRDRVVARRPQASQKYFSSSRLGKQTCRGSDAVFPQNSQTAIDKSSAFAGLQRCPFWVVLFPQVVQTWSWEVDALAMIPSFSVRSVDGECACFLIVVGRLLSTRKSTII
jgi:hypothetical protein